MYTFATNRRFTTDQEAVMMGEDPTGEIVSRLEALEQAVAIIAINRAGGEEGDTGDNVDPDIQTRNVQRQERERIDNTLPGRGASANRFDRPPTGDEIPSPEDINARQAKFWGLRTPETMSAMGSPVATPAPGRGRESEAANFMPNAQGTVDPVKRLSSTPKTLETDRTWGTNDNIMRRINAEKERCQRTNSVIDMINRKNAAAYLRRG